MKRKFLSALLALVMILSLAAGVSAEEGTITSGDWTYKLTSDGAVLTEYIGTDTEVVAPGTIDGHDVWALGPGIGCAFSNVRETMTSLTLEEGIDYIQTNAVKGCTALETVVIADTVTSIGTSAFENCTGLTDVYLGEGMKTISTYAFLNTGLTSLYLPASVNLIYDHAFGYSGEWGDVEKDENFAIFGWAGTYAQTYATKWHFTFYFLDEMTDTSGLCGEYASWRFDAATGTLYIESIGKEDGVCATAPYYNCIQPWIACADRIERVVVGEGITYLGDGFLADHYPNLTEVSLPSTLGGIGNFAFRNCTGLTSLDIPAECSFFGGSAFKGSGLRTLVVPGADPFYGSYFGSQALADCADLTSVRFTGDAWEFSGEPFRNSKLTAWYPADNATWTESVMQQYGGKISWNAYDPDLFVDVAVGSFYHEPVVWAVENGITTGATATTFDPNGECLRAHVVTFLWRAEGCPEPESTVNPFVDVKESDFYYKAVLWAVENGITNGSDATHFNPMGVCNRAQVVTFLHRAKGSPAPRSMELAFTDVPADEWFTAPVAWAVENGITNGLSATEFGPDAACNRAQVVTFLYRAKDVPKAAPSETYTFNLVSNDPDEEIGFVYIEDIEYNAGDAVRFYAEPWFGYAVEFTAEPEIEGLELCYLGLHTYELTMPAQDLTICANFAPINGSWHTITTSCTNGEAFAICEMDEDWNDVAKPGEHIIFYIYPDEGHVLTAENVRAVADGVEVEQFWFLGEFVDEYPEADYIDRYYVCELVMPDADVTITIDCTEGAGASAAQQRMIASFK